MRAFLFACLRLPIPDVGCQQQLFTPPSSGEYASNERAAAAGTFPAQGS
jgi:hypothetical protein